MPTTPCECLQAGHCLRHDCFKTERWWELCQTNQKYFDLWERGDGPCIESVKVKYCEWQPQPGGKHLHVCKACGSRWNGKKPKARVCPATMPKRKRAQQPVNAPRVGCCGGRSAVLPVPVTVKPPSFLKRALSFAREMKDWTLEGLPVVGDGELEARKLACSECRFRDGDWCLGCGCYLPLAQKVATKKCPMALWPGGDTGWTPSVHEEWLRKVCVIMPVCGHDELTEKAVADCDREGVAVKIIDGCGKGWLKATNQGLEMHKKDYEFFVVLNNDVRLSRGFFAGLMIAHVQTGADMVSACYNVGWKPQKPTHQDQPSADKYEPRPVHRQVPLTDGTCVMVTKKLVEQVGLLDEQYFGKYGHAATSDLAIRAKMLGMEAYVTEAAYCYHYGSQTAAGIHGDTYLEKAQGEAREGLVAKYGPEYGKFMEPLRLLPAKTEITVRNVVYHVYPNESGEWNVGRLLERPELFNGKRIACVVHNGQPAGSIIETLRKHHFTVIFRENDAKLCDSVAFMDMLAMVANTNPNEATFVGHTKGASKNIARKWANHMYDHCLVRSPEMMAGLEEHACAGSLIQRYLPNPPHFIHKAHWHYAGSFYWLRHDATFSRNWRIDSLNRYTIEAFPGVMFSSFEAFALGPEYREVGGL